MDTTFESLKKDLESLKKTIDPFLYRHYVTDFLSSLPSSFPDSEDALKKLEVQKKDLLLLDPEVKRLFGRFRKGLFPIIEKLYSPEFIGFRDLTKASDEILTGHSMLLLTETTYLGGVSKDEFLSRFQGELDIQQKELQGLVRRGQERVNQKKEIELFSKKIQTIFSALLLYKDLRPSIEQLIEKNRSFLLPFSLPKEASQQEIEVAFVKRYEEFKTFSSSIEDEKCTIEAKRENLEYRCQDALLTIRCRLFEIFFAVTSYPDLEDEFRLLQEFLSKRLEDSLSAFYEGKIGIDDLSVACQELAYEHDVVRMRNEVSHRALRLKDLRDELLRLIRALHDETQLLFLANGSKEAFFAPLMEENKKLEQLLEEVENPFLSFLKADSKDACNGVFRAFWMRIEGLQPRVESLLEKSRAFAQKNYQSIQEKFLKVLDDMEEVLSAYDAIRPSLVTRAEQGFSESEVQSEVRSEVLSKELFLQIHQIEVKYPFSEPLSFFMLEPDFKIRREMLAKAKRLEGSLKELRDFSKTMQYIKTFEEERIDAFLEGLEHLHIYELVFDKNREEVFKKSFHRMAFASLAIEEEVFADIGLLDAHALMDIDPNHLEKILQIAYVRSKNRLSRYFHEIEKIQSVSPLFERTKKAVFEDLETVAKGEVDKDYLAALRLFCHSIYSLRILKAAARQDIQAMGLLVLHDLHLLYLQIGREGTWSKPLSVLVMKTHAFTLKSTQELETFVRKIFLDLRQISEVARGFDLEERQNEIEEYLRIFSRIAGRCQVPFEFLPGCMAFFLRKRSFLQEGHQEEHQEEPSERSIPHEP